MACHEACASLPQASVGALLHGGGAGIRTLGTGINPYNGLASRRNRPLCHPSFGQVVGAIVLGWHPLSRALHFSLVVKFGPIFSLALSLSKGLPRRSTPAWASTAASPLSTSVLLIRKTSAGPLIRIPSAAMSRTTRCAIVAVPELRADPQLVCVGAYGNTPWAATMFAPGAASSGSSSGSSGLSCAAGLPAPKGSMTLFLALIFGLGLVIRVSRS